MAASRLEFFSVSRPIHDRIGPDPRSGLAQLHCRRQRARLRFPDPEPALWGIPSALCCRGPPARRPCGQTKRAEDMAPVYRASRNLDYELELGFYIGTPSRLGTAVPIAEAGAHVFGFCLLNDWSARDIQAWESQPLGPFLAKNFSPSVSPSVSTAAPLPPLPPPALPPPPSDPSPPP